MFFIIFLLISSPPPKTTNNPLIFSAPLIHISSLNSPFYDRTYTRENHVENGALSSLERARFFSQGKTTQENYAFRAPLSGWNMLMKYSLGTPPVDAYGVFDTGSSFTWMQCLPCLHCYNQGDYRLFDPNNSYSYQVVHCLDPECRMTPKSSCHESFESCVYYTSYLDTTVSRGVVSVETITLGNTSKRVVFGCGNDNQENVGGWAPGIVGVGNLSFSLPRQLNVNHFSYYVSANGARIHGMAYFGPGASMSDFGMTTPLLPNNHGLYFLNLTGVSVDGSDLDFPRGVFEHSVDYKGNVMGFIIDSGTTYTTLRSEAFEVLKNAVMEEMYEYTPESYMFFELCYRDVSGAPEVVFQFAGLDFALCDANLWVRFPGLHCMAIMRNKASVEKLSILGFHQQRNVHVGFDLEKNLLSVVYPGPCPDNAVDFVQN